METHMGYPDGNPYGIPRWDTVNYLDWYKEDSNRQMEGFSLFFLVVGLGGGRSLKGTGWGGRRGSHLLGTTLVPTPE